MDQARVDPDMAARVAHPRVAGKGEKGKDVSIVGGTILSETVPNPRSATNVVSPDTCEPTVPRRARAKEREYTRCKWRRRQSKSRESWDSTALKW